MVSKYPELEVVHRCFALAPRPESIEEIFGNKAKGKHEILNHWRAANLNDDEHRINADLMAARDFDYPYSMPGLRACKAAELQRGQSGHWDMFDRVQKAHLTECRNIADENVLIDCAKDIGLDADRFVSDFMSQTVLDLVWKDLREAAKLGVHAVPTLVINRRYAVVGAVQEDVLDLLFEQVVETGEVLTRVPGVVSIVGDGDGWRIT